ncbi:hypothetical protein MPI44_000263 [Klebsiella oxytoca]|uniref:hypothetical protein n=1 Tax=Klebsiella oxytoca TaxID=571 RepID=UPI0004137CF1|nr:hypothetical protein [Klebsiella oxytoca]EGT3581503.1 hypothetical protein [Klebsiella oxytoca]EIZ1081817.1 hypothetical protein [Klebsiella oxytoca]ELT9694428.1 hypothetical protein [Klebsiella oxytoca]MBG2653657.1 hypothetical protein [Klebsiella oxytoca]MBS6495034.1 hypothetical protein [Klebsiella oxytoca]
MKNLKIEYVDGQLVTVDVEGISMLNAGLSGLNFSHFLGKEPHLKFEVGGEIPEGLVPVQPQEPAQAQAFEGEHLPAETAPRHQRNRNKNRNRNRSH